MRDSFYPQKIFPTSEEVFALIEELCYGSNRSNGIVVTFFVYVLVDIVICFFETDLSLLICLSVIKVKRKEVVTMTSVRYSCKTLKTSKWTILLGWKEINLCLMVSSLHWINAGWENHHPLKRSLVEGMD